MHWKESQENWLMATEAAGRSPRTVEGYRWHLVKFNHWLEEAGIEDISAFSPFHLRRFLLEFGKGRSPHTVQGVYGNLRTWFRWMVAEGILEESPTEKVKPPRVPQSSKQVYSSGELRTLVEGMEKTKSPLALRDAALVSTLTDTGVRATELLSTTLDDIQGDCLLLRNTKGKRPRLVPLGSKSQRALWLYLQRARPRLRPKDKTVFITPGGQPMSRNALRCMLMRLGKSLGFPVSAHRFRHTWATMMLRKGVDFETLRRMGGWADYEMLKTYSHLSIEDLKRTQERHSLLDNL